MNKPLYELFESEATDEEILTGIAAGASVNETRPLTEGEIEEADVYPLVTPLQYAVKQRRSEKVIRALVEAGADVNAFVNYSEIDEILTAAGAEDPEEVLFYSAVDRIWIGAHSPLCIALLNQDCEMVELLGKLGADPYAIYMEGTNDERSLKTIARHSNFDEDDYGDTNTKVWESYTRVRNNEYK